MEVWRDAVTLGPSEDWVLFFCRVPGLSADHAPKGHTPSGMPAEVPTENSQDNTTTFSGFLTQC